MRDLNGTELLATMTEAETLATTMNAGHWHKAYVACPVRTDRKTIRGYAVTNTGDDSLYGKGGEYIRNTARRDD